MTGKDVEEVLVNGVGVGTLRGNFKEKKYSIFVLVFVISFIQNFITKRNSHKGPDKKDSCTISNLVSFI